MLAAVVDKVKIIVVVIAPKTLLGTEKPAVESGKLTEWVKNKPMAWAYTI